MTVLAWIVLAFVCGSLPFAVWIGRWRMGVDIRQVGDGNPGTANVFRAGGRFWGTIAMILDFLKGAVPVGLADRAGQLDGWELALVAIAPVLGHAYSPLLRFRGGKALATTFGIWTGLTLWRGPVILGLNLAVGTALLAADGWVVLIGMLSLLSFLTFTQSPMPLMGVAIANTVLLSWKYRQSLRQRPPLRKWLAQRLHSIGLGL